MLFCLYELIAQDLFSLEEFLESFVFYWVLLRGQGEHTWWGSGLTPGSVLSKSLLVMLGDPVQC